MKQLKKTTKRKSREIGLVCGMGIRDMSVVDEHGRHAKAHATWSGIFQRLTDRNNSSFDTYADCSIHESWTRLSGFAAWHEPRYRDGYDLDKDILVPGNKIYGPSTCCYVPHYINLLINSSMKNNTSGVPGANWNKHAKQYQVNIKIFGKQNYLGLYKTLEDAASAYNKAKRKQIRHVAYWSYELGDIDEEVYVALLKRADQFK